MGRLLLRDLAQLATPAVEAAPARGTALGEVTVVEDAFVLCADGVVEAAGRMADLPPLDGDVEELDCRGRCAVPGLVDCHTHPAWAGDRVEEFALRARGAGYEEIHAAGGGILSTVRATRAAGEEVATAVERHRRWMLGAGTTTWEGKSGYGLDRETELASLRAVAAAGGVPTWLGAHAVPPEFDRADDYLDFALAEVLPEAARIAEAADVFLERGAFDAAQARRYLEACREHGLALRLHGDQFTEAGAIPLAVELGARSVDHLEATGDHGVRTLAASDVAGVLLPVAALVLDRPMPPARALVDAGAVVALATDFNPGSAFCESLPLVCSLAATQLQLTPAEALTACTVNAAHVLGRHEAGRIAPGFRADIVLLEAPDWRYLAYHLAGEVVAGVIAGGEVGMAGVELIRELDASSPSDIEAARDLFREYADGLGVDLGFQDFERELAELPAGYLPPSGVLLLAEHDAVVVGCVGVRAAPRPDACEMKRLYVRSAARGSGLGRRLATEAIAVGRRLGYRRMLLDTLPTMAAAHALYERLGFRETDAYRFNPVAGTRYLALELRPDAG